MVVPISDCLLIFVKQENLPSVNESKVMIKEQMIPQAAFCVRLLKIDIL